MIQLAMLEGVLAVVVRRTGLAVYDFDFESCFAATHPSGFDGVSCGVARVGAVEDYEAVYDEWRARGVAFINTPGEAAEADDLARWYPKLRELTPESWCVEAWPRASEVASAFGWPVFIKGNRQTSRHNAGLCVARSAAEYERLRERWGEDSILASQGMVLRRWTPLCVVREAERADELPRCFEFRTFWWEKELVGAGRYWMDAGGYEWDEADRVAACAVAREAACRLTTPFVCIDVAKHVDGSWLVIEANDGQRAGYAGVPRVAMWRRVLDLVRVGGGG